MAHQATQGETYYGNAQSFSSLTGRTSGLPFGIYSYGNLVRVREFNGEPDDDELLLLEQYLETLSKEANLRLVEKRNWKAKVELKGLDNFLKE